MKITKIWFDNDFICGLDEENKEYRQSLLWYPRLLEVSDEERQKYTFGFCGIHWRELNEDISSLGLSSYLNEFINSAPRSFMP